MSLLILFKKLARQLFQPRYHPERHYMRGPGPKCRAADSTPMG